MIVGAEIIWNRRYNRSRFKGLFRLGKYISHTIFCTENFSFSQMKLCKSLVKKHMTCDCLKQKTQSVLRGLKFISSKLKLNAIYNIIAYNSLKKNNYCSQHRWFLLYCFRWFDCLHWISFEIFISCVGCTSLKRK